MVVVVDGGSRRGGGSAPDVHVAVVVIQELASVFLLVIVWDAVGVVLLVPVLSLS